jgi:hypothetical protein
VTAYRARKLAKPEAKCLEIRRSTVALGTHLVVRRTGRSPVGGAVCRCGPLWWATLRASVLITEGRIAVWPIFSGHIARGVSARSAPVICLARGGREDRNRNAPTRIHVGVSDEWHVDQENFVNLAKAGSYLGFPELTKTLDLRAIRVSDLSALGNSPCARRAIRPEHALNHNATHKVRQAIDEGRSTLASTC